MAAEGRQEKMVAKEQKGAAKAQGLAQGTHDHVQGQQQAMHGSMAGDRSHQMAGELRGAKGQAEQEFNRGHAF
ncbi:hypothetical protein BJ165DRAFT_1451746 [Panaeolus papilionaceus]|nr:hypothetical protein BJ165DRAFT_1451746 [Panaeolus papilionaceus]